MKLDIGHVTIEQLQRSLSLFFRGRRVLLILDDIWTDGINTALLILQVMSQATASGARVLVTTREAHVCSQLSAYSYALLPLVMSEYSFSLVVSNYLGKVYIARL